jgi:hypothetical protein
MSAFLLLPAPWIFPSSSSPPLESYIPGFLAATAGTDFNWRQQQRGRDERFKCQFGAATPASGGRRGKRLAVTQN